MMTFLFLGWCRGNREVDGGLNDVIDAVPLIRLRAAHQSRRYMCECVTF